jgi:hypothetical protein
MECGMFSIFTIDVLRVHTTPIREGVTLCDIISVQLDSGVGVRGLIMRV